MQFIKEKFADDPARAYTEEISRIDQTLDQVNKYRRPFLFIIPIALQTLAVVLVAALFLPGSEFQADLLWITDLSSHDPYYLVPVILLISLVIRHKQFLPHKKKFVLYLFAFIWCFFNLTAASGPLLFVISLLLLSTVQSSILDRRYKRGVVIDEDESISMSTDSD